MKKIFLKSKLKFTIENTEIKQREKEAIIIPEFTFKQRSDSDFLVYSKKWLEYSCPYVDSESFANLLVNYLKNELL